ncbi:UPF0149 family protein [Paraburkholderia sp. BCC1886]|uniref:UPF0149 family protein n=1 Tax=Paraburkholderia sp. BCC1886 TaxID=2562670 RepID=UPI001182B772|nr:UPF0149 family protein [Paraburkholderia sp. BCC1886]
MSRAKLKPADLDRPLSDAEFEELDTFLVSDVTSEETLTIEALDGYLTALAIGPTTLAPNYWLPRVWGPSEADTPAFDSVEEAQHILGLILRQMNGIIASIESDPDGFEPVFGFVVTDEQDREYIDGGAWAMGFMQGLELVRADWQPLFDSEEGQAWLRPLHLLGALELTPEEEALVEAPEQEDALTRQIPASIAAIFRYWLPHREEVDEQMPGTIERADPKVGRNDPCPCGSGKKFKKCCGAAATLH